MKQPTYPVLCRSLYCGSAHPSDCIGCSNKPELDAYRAAWAAWAAEQGVPDLTGASHPYNSPALAGWGGGDR